VGLVQLVRFLVVELIYSGLSHRFNMYVIFTTNYSFSQKRRPVNNETLLMIDFVNLKIKTARTFRCVHNDSVCTYIYRDERSYVYKYLRLYCVSQKKESSSSAK
jgi:hypothetical protein